ncbi:hypothetical protein BLX87_15265 [Bacillus sp. VT-16-64]|nr:hypothetical protein BLX87_15265 [Bacillus sp. VT-16-64]
MVERFGKGFVFFIIATVIVIIASSYVAHKIGYQNATTLLEDKKLTIEEMENELSEIKKEQKQKSEELEQLKDEYQEATALVDQKDELQTNVDQLQVNTKQKSEEVASLDTQIKEKQKELEKLENGVVEKKEEPKTLAAGQFEVGKDIPEGRYKVQPNGGRGNFFVNDGLKVNVILGHFSDEMYLKEYVISLSEGDIIKSTLPTKYIPIE